MLTLNVLRYSALGAGILYGAVHRYNLESASVQQEKQAKFAHEAKLIKQAKAEYAKLHAPKNQGSSITQINFEDPNVDFGKVLESLVQKLD